MLIRLVLSLVSSYQVRCQVAASLLGSAQLTGLHLPGLCISVFLPQAVCLHSFLHHAGFYMPGLLPGYTTRPWFPDLARPARHAGFASLLGSTQLTGLHLPRLCNSVFLPQAVYYTVLCTTLAPTCQGCYQGILPTPGLMTLLDLYTTLASACQGCYQGMLPAPGIRTLLVLLRVSLSPWFSPARVLPVCTTSLGRGRFALSCAPVRLLGRRSAGN